MLKGEGKIVKAGSEATEIIDKKIPAKIINKNENKKEVLFKFFFGGIGELSIQC